MGLGAEDRINLYRIPVVPHLHVQPTTDQKTAQETCSEQVQAFTTIPSAIHPFHSIYIAVSIISRVQMTRYIEKDAYRLYPDSVAFYIRTFTIHKNLVSVTVLKVFKIK